MSANLSPSEFVDLLEEVWSRRGWKTKTRRRDDGSYAVIGRRRDGTRGLLYVVPDGEVTGQRIQQFVTLCETRDIDVPVVATRGVFTDHASRVAEANDVHLVDPGALVDVLEEAGFVDLLERYGGPLEVNAGVDAGASSARRNGSGDGETKERGGDADSPLATAFAVLARLVDAVEARAGVDIRAAIERLPFDPSASLGAFPRSAVVGVVVVAVFGVGIVTGGVLGGDAEAAPSGPAVSALSTGSDDEWGLRVHWDARAGSSLAVPDGPVYEAPDGETFVVVRLDVTNGASSPVEVSPRRFVFESDGIRYGHQPLADSTGLPREAVQPGETVSGWVAFSVSARTTAGTLIARQDGESPRLVRFVHDPEMEEIVSIES